MNRLNLPWVRNYEQLSMDIDADNNSILNRFCTLLVFVALCAVGVVILMDGLDKSAAYEQAKAQGEQRGRVEMLLRVKDAVEEQGNTLEAYYSAASKPGMSGFDGVLLVENKR